MSKEEAVNILQLCVNEVSFHVQSFCDADYMNSYITVAAICLSAEVDYSTSSSVRFATLIF